MDFLSFEEAVSSIPRLSRRPIEWLPPEGPFNNEWLFAALELPRTNPNPLRKSMTPKITRGFRRAALNTVQNPKLRDNINGNDLWQIHHIVPLGLGGKHKFKLMALLPQPLHLVITQFIEEQTRGMVMGERRVVLLPWRSGLVWTTKHQDIYNPRKWPQPVVEDPRRDEQEQGRRRRSFDPDTVIRPSFAQNRCFNNVCFAGMRA